ncbi:SWIM zinc finger family protein [Paenibacillus lemnae]|uniref:SWIM-type domain-containing protein n=1 Tax=Paenibacillus lemnae TaxID=1330551 RepID=A0A848MAF4_PAELE|nr:SWIM zinc finger family protein [Paenibacillus lemnae]NMO96454.1 hypothetical protein [Paenibacillus lemnae]
MNLAQPLDDLEWQTLIQNTAAYFSDLMIKRGFQYYKQNRVKSMQLHESGEIDAIVNGGKSYQVRILPESLENSACTCPVGEACKHMAAVLFQAASSQGRSVLALANAHSYLDVPKIVTRDKPQAVQAQKPPSAVKQHQEALAALRDQASRMQDMPISAWHELFQKMAAMTGTPASSPLYARNMLAALTDIKPSSAEKSRPLMDALYDLHARLFVLDKLIGQPQAPGAGATLFMGYHVQMAADDIAKDVHRRLQSEAWAFRLEDNDGSHQERLTETLHWLRGKMLIEPRNHPFFSQIYNRLWIDGIAPYCRNQETFRHELQQLRTAELELAPGLRASGMFAQSLMHFYLNEDEMAWDLLRAADKALYIQPVHLLHFLQVLKQNASWKRLTEWLVQAGPLLASYRNQRMDEYMSYWEHAVEHIPHAEQQLWDTLSEMLPYSSQIYQDALLSRGQWRKWMDYQLSTGREPLEFRVTVLAPIEKEAPELLLPFYHQAVERYILQKNRSSYKSAVKLLKRLAKLYKKLKQTERWNAFMDTFAERHSRLRALQEELRRGKLIS